MNIRNFTAASFPALFFASSILPGHPLGDVRRGIVEDAQIGVHSFLDASAA
jgi:hypothetical protein